MYTGLLTEPLAKHSVQNSAVISIVHLGSCLNICHLKVLFIGTLTIIHIDLCLVQVLFKKKHILEIHCTSLSLYERNKIYY